MSASSTPNRGKVRIHPLVGGDRATITLDEKIIGVIVKTTVGGVWCIEGDETQYGYRSKVAAAAAVVDRHYAH